MNRSINLNRVGVSGSFLCWFKNSFKYFFNVSGVGMPFFISTLYALLQTFSKLSSKSFSAYCPSSVVCLLFFTRWRSLLQFLGSTVCLVEKTSLRPLYFH